MDANEAGRKADELIATEIGRQDVMWGIANERADSTKGQLLAAGLSQLEALYDRREGITGSFNSAPDTYPSDWSGFRDYGSDVANIVVGIAYLRQEAKRLIAAGADTTRTSRNPTSQPYLADQPTAILP